MTLYGITLFNQHQSDQRWKFITTFTIIPPVQPLEPQDIFSSYQRLKYFETMVVSLMLSLFPDAYDDNYVPLDINIAHMLDSFCQASLDVLRDM